MRLAMHGIRKAFGATQALDGVDLAVAAGECLALIGENGAGKSTLMKVLSGVHAADAGTMELDGSPYRPRDPADAQARGVAIVHQELSLALHLPVAENLFLGRLPTRFGLVDRPALMSRARAALARVGIPDLDPRHPAGALPVAARQLVEIARALSQDPRVLILDEPTSSLSADETRRLLALVRQLAADGMAVVFISHALEDCRAVATRFCVLRDGASVAGGPLAGTGDADLVRAMAGRAMGDLYPPRLPRVPGEVVLSCRKLAGRRLPASADLELRRGEIVGVFGLMGAGRSEWLRILFGLDPAAGGTLDAPGGAGQRSPRTRWLAGAGLVSEDRKGEGLMLARDVAENLALPCLGRFAPGGWLRRRRLHAAASDWIAALGIRTRGPRQAVGELSGGNQQKVALGRLLLSGSEVWLLDEPTRGIDVGAKAAIYRLMQEQASSGRAILMASSYLPELVGTCDRIAVMRRGVLGPARPLAEWGADPAAAILAEAVGLEGMQNAECRMQNAECRMQNAECRMQNAE